MGGKFEKKRSRKTFRSKGKKGGFGKILLLIAIAAFVVLAGYVAASRNHPEPVEMQKETTQPAATEPEKTLTTLTLDRRLKVEKIGKYTGMYMEDGTDEIVADVLMMVITNIGNEPIQYAEIELEADEEMAYFTVSTLPEGKTVVLLEKNRMSYDPEIPYLKGNIAAKHIAVHQEPLGLQQDKLQIQILDGAINVTNISGEDISQDIVIYYKNSKDGVMYGGITYRIKLEGGLQAGQIQQIMATHFHEGSSEIVNITVGA